MEQQVVHILGMQENFSKCGLNAKNNEEEYYIAEIMDTINWIQDSEEYKICQNCKLDYLETVCEWTK